MAEKSVKKSKGRVYTPDFIIENILDLSHYYGNGILYKHVIDNSCGDGAFLCKIISRYCDVALKNNISKDDLKLQLETYIHGIEIDPVEHKKCLENLRVVLKNYEINDIDLDIICDDALTVTKYAGKMDFVLGNPPYIRVHNLGTSLETMKKFSFAQSGMKDIYIVFYEIGLKMLNNNGVLGYITPSSFFSSLAGEYMRKYLVKEKLIEALVDLKHYQAFNAMTYTAIVILNKKHHSDTVEYYQFDEKNQIPYYVETLTSEDYYIANKFYFSNKRNLLLLKKILLNIGSCDIRVKNGYATLCDTVFVGPFDFKSKFIIPVIKASRGEFSQIIYPYNEQGKFVSESEISNDTQLYKYLCQNKDILLKRSCENGEHSCWYAFGRSQAINDTYKDKISINALLRTSKDLKIVNAPAGTGVYSGLYLIGSKEELKKARNILQGDEFSEYVSLLGKYKSGGYYTFSSKDVKAYLDYKLTYNGGLVQ